MKNLLALCAQKAYDDGSYEWVYDGIIVVEFENLTFRAHSEAFRVRLLRFLKQNNIRFRERFDTKLEPYYEISQGGFEKFLNVSK